MRDWSIIPTNNRTGPDYWPKIGREIFDFKASPAIINRLVNLALKYTPDDFDEWASPATSLRRGAGDCEDFAILKMALLKRHNPRLSVGFDGKGRAHAVAVIEIDGQDWCLDNLTDNIYPLDSGRFRPAYLLSHTGRKWLALETREHKG